jgi:homocysteine S-methyltransferase
MKFSDRIILDSPLILDGAMGSELEARGVALELPLWSASVLWENPKLVSIIHQDYLRAGADILTTNTFRVDRRTFNKVNLGKERVCEAVNNAVALCRQAISIAADERDIFVAGSVTTLEDCYFPERAPSNKIALREHREKTAWLAEAGVDFILIETMNTAREARIASQAAVETGLPVITSLIPGSDTNLLGGDDLILTCRQILDEGVLGFGLNCNHHQIISLAIARLMEVDLLPLVVYANSSRFDSKHWISDQGMSPERYAEEAAAWMTCGIKIIGTCCGLGPDYIHAVSEKIKSPG